MDKFEFRALSSSSPSPFPLLHFSFLFHSLPFPFFLPVSRWQRIVQTEHFFSLLGPCFISFFIATFPLPSSSIFLLILLHFHFTPSSFIFLHPFSYLSSTFFFFYPSLSFFPFIIHQLFFLLYPFSFHLPHSSSSSSTLFLCPLSSSPFRFPPLRNIPVSDRPSLWHQRPISLKDWTSKLHYRTLLPALLAVWYRTGRRSNHRTPDSLETLIVG